MSVGVRGRTVVLAGLLGCSATSAPPDPAVGVSSSTIRERTRIARALGDPRSAALAAVRATAATARAEWSAIRVTRGRDGRDHVRLQQQHEGLRVIGSDIVVHVGAADVDGIAGHVTANLDAIATSPAIARDAALAIARAAHASSIITRETSELAIAPATKSGARLVWDVRFVTDRAGGGTPGRWRYLVDATSGAILERANTLATVDQASGPGGNARVARTWTAALDVTAEGDRYAMRTDRLETLDLGNAEAGGTVVTGPLAAIGDAAINDAHGFAELTLDMLSSWQGRSSIDDAGLVIRSRVHYATDYDNAFWDGEQMTYGDGGFAFYPLSGALDVVAHEINHGFTEHHSNLNYEGEPGGLNESFSDIAGTAAEFFVAGNRADFTIGRDILRAAGGGLRDMCDPTSDGVSIDHYDHYANQDVHYTSGIPNKAFCRAARRFASGDPDGPVTVASVRRVSQAFFEANAGYWTQGATFEEGCQGVLDAAAALGYSETERTALRASWRDVGVYCDGEVAPIRCDQTLGAPDGTLHSPNYPSDYPSDLRRTWCIRPAGGAEATLTFNAFATEAGFDFVTVRDGVTGRVLSRTSGTTAPSPATSSFLVVQFTSDSGTAGFGWLASWSSDVDVPPPPPPPDAGELDVDAGAGPTPPSDAGEPVGTPGPALDGDGGGGCASSRGTPAAGFVIVLSVVVLSLRRRRRS